MDEPNTPLTTYLPPEVTDYPGKWLVAIGESGPEDVFLFLQPGRDRSLPREAPTARESACLRSDGLLPSLCNHPGS